MTRSKLLRLRYIATDLLSIVLSYVLFNSVRFHVEQQDQLYADISSYLFSSKSLWVGLIYLAFWMGLFALSGYYNKPVAKSRISELLITFNSTLIGSVIVFLLLVVDDLVHDTALYLKLFSLLFAIVFLVVYIPRLLTTNWGIRMRRLHPRYRRVLLLGSGSEAENISKWLKKTNELVVERIPIESPEDGRSPEEIFKLCLPLVHAAIERHKPDSIVLVVDSNDARFISNFLYRLYAIKIPIRIPVRSMLFAGVKIKMPSLKEEPMIDLTETNMSESSKNIKWLIDRIVSILILIIFSPLYLALAIGVRLSSPGPIIFGQERIGLHGKPFTIYKFRTMHLGAEKDGPQLSHDTDPRITKYGLLLRKYRLDELPQFWNVLRGDMSLVGPRPERAYYINKLVETAPYYYLLHNVRPGITSWGMVKYGYASTVEEMLERLKYDFLYYENMSLRLDVEVLFYTIFTIAKGLGK